MKRATILCIDDERTVLIALRDQLKNHLERTYVIEMEELQCLLEQRSKA